MFLTSRFWLQEDQWVAFASTSKQLCFRLEYAKPVELLSVRVSGNAWMGKRPGHHLVRAFRCGKRMERRVTDMCVPQTLYNDEMNPIAEKIVHSDEDINVYMEVNIDLDEKQKVQGKIFYIEEKQDLCILRNYRVVARPFRPAVPKGSILDDIRSLFNNQELSDLTLVVQGKPIYCNRSLLAVRCPVFKAMLYGPMKEGQQVTVPLLPSRFKI